MYTIYNKHTYLVLFSFWLNCCQYHMSFIKFGHVFLHVILSFFPYRHLQRKGVSIFSCSVFGIFSFVVNVSKISSGIFGQLKNHSELLRLSDPWWYVYIPKDIRMNLTALGYNQVSVLRWSETQVNDSIM